MSIDTNSTDLPITQNFPSQEGIDVRPDDSDTESPVEGAKSTILDLLREEIRTTGYEGRMTMMNSGLTIVDSTHPKHQARGGWKIYIKSLSVGRDPLEEIPRTPLLTPLLKILGPNGFQAISAPGKTDHLLFVISALTLRRSAGTGSSFTGDNNGRSSVLKLPI